jgi:hypothetical protein
MLAGSGAIHVFLFMFILLLKKWYFDTFWYILSYDFKLLDSSLLYVNMYGVDIHVFIIGKVSAGVSLHVFDQRLFRCF